MPTVQLYVSHNEMRSLYEAATAAGYETPNEWIIHVLTAKLEQIEKERKKNASN